MFHPGCGLSIFSNSNSITESNHEHKDLAIVPVKVKGRGSGKIITTYSLLDNGSTSTWCSDSLAKKLGVVVPHIQVSLTIEKDCNPTSCHNVCLEIMDMNEINMIELCNILNLRTFENNKIHSLCMVKSGPRKNQSERSDLQCLIIKDKNSIPGIE